MSEESDEQHRLLVAEQRECEEKIRGQGNVSTNRGVAQNSGCPMTWDGAFCWPGAAPGELLIVSCPGYVHGFNTEERASKQCTLSGTWWEHWETGEPWTNYTLCPFPRWQAPLGINSTLLTPHLPIIKLISKLGYTFSLVTLIVAFFVIASVRRLRCPRNKLHLHLFLSFIMRALMFLLKDTLYEAGMDGRGPKISFDGLQVVLDWESSVECRVFTSFWQYFLMANYSWILMEGLYLHNLIFLTMFTDTSGICRYVLAGWGVPILFILSWVIVRITLENTLCWTTNENPGYFWIIRGPITIAIILNFIFFLNMTRVLFLKLFSASFPQARHFRYRKWFRSTLVLVPLFGVHYALLLAMSLAAGVHELVELIWLYTDQLFSSFQGAVVAFLYCFLNSEVRTETRKALSPVLSLRVRPMAGFCQEKNSTSTCTQSLSLLSRSGRCSVHSLNSPKETPQKVFLPLGTLQLVLDVTFHHFNKVHGSKYRVAVCEILEDSKF